MQPRAFVVMPYGVKVPGHEFRGVHSPARSARAINFDLIFEGLLQPALKNAGFEVARSDSAPNAGDIRTDMFFELVTADLVVADVSILNANVYYELGVRHGVCPRGVFVVSASDPGMAPFDIAPDRRFMYDISFLFDEHELPVETLKDVDRRKLDAEVERLAKTFRDAGTIDQQTIGSPVYSHLPGLKPVDWEDIETSKAKYFNALQNDWRDCVRRAQANHRPADILTLARHSPTRLHEARILYEAAIALLNLSRYSAAKTVLADVVRLNPDHVEAKLNLALTTANLGDTTAAEQHLRQILEQHKTDPRADDLLGQVFRYLWRLSWQGGPDATRRTRAKDASLLAISAMHSFFRAHRSDSRAYFAGFNALMLAFVLQELGISETEMGFGHPPYSAPDHREHLRAVVRYTATCEHQQALEAGDYVTQFWCTTTLAGLNLIEDQNEAALVKIREACAIPAATSFQLQTFRDRLQLVLDLGVRTSFLANAIEIVETALNDRLGHCRCAHVVLWFGSRLVTPDPEGRRPVAADLSIRIKAALDHWDVKPGDLAICGAANESDIIFAETCLEKKLRVQILVREPSQDERDGTPRWPALASSCWHDRLRDLYQREETEVFIDSDRLGPMPSDQQNPARRSICRHKQWLLNTATMAASHKLRPGKTPSDVNPVTLHGLFLWNGIRTADDPYDPSELVHDVERFDGYRGKVTIIDILRWEQCERPDVPGREQRDDDSIIATRATVGIHLRPVDTLPTRRSREGASSIDEIELRDDHLAGT